ncbi:nitroreductase family protein [Qaidamihabitans albus]|uniref:nitroreductase family protein n=1 Tax=Qaidamihabitans albus TaxID=2795733 RepID=UPI001F3DBF77|nr:nitroreductase family protein [Qaidamihabitans albus]
MVRQRTELPDRDTLAEETVLLFLSQTDTRSSHVRTGIAMQQTWLAAVDAGLVAAVQTQPLQLPEVRSRLAQGLGVEGYPQLLMRVGYAAGPVPQSPRRAVAEILHHGDG